MATDEARQLQADDLHWRAATVAGQLQSAAAAVVHVGADGELLLGCSCGERIPTLQRLTSHMQLHASAAREGVPWDEVEKRLAALAYRRGVQERSARLLPVERAPRDDDPGE